MELEHGTRSSEHSRTSLDGNEIDKSSETPLKVAGVSGHPNLTNVNEIKLLEMNSASSSSAKPTNPFLSMEDNNNNYPEVFCGSYSNDYQSVQTVTIDDEDDLFSPSIKLGTSSSSSSSTPRSASSVDIWKMNAVEDVKPISANHENENAKSASPAIEDTSSSKHANEDTKSASPSFVPEDNKISIAKNSSPKSETSDNCSSTSSLTFQVADSIREQLEGDMSPTLSPQIQVMDRSGGYDPSRIPSSVFETSNTTTPMDWSVCSNESLFSIHVGNNSFSRDQMLMFGDLGKSGELTKSGELYVLSPTPPLQITDIDTNSLDKWKEPEVEGITDLSIRTQPYVNMKNKKSETVKFPPSLYTEDKISEKIPPAAAKFKSPSPPRRSDGRGTSTHSFVFPIKEKLCSSSSCFCSKCRKKNKQVSGCKEKKRACPSCYCSNCSWAFCYCTWPSFYWAWPSCHCSYCSWAFC